MWPTWLLNKVDTLVRDLDHKYCKEEEKKGVADSGRTRYLKAPALVTTAMSSAFHWL